MTVTGRVSDNQRGSIDGRGVAEFFLGTFLGCNLAVNPARATQQFASATEEFINTAVASPHTAGRYQPALLSTLHEQSLDVVPREFALRHLDTADRPAFYEAVRNSGLDPDSGFEKETSLVRFERFRMTFESGMILVGAWDNLGQQVRIRPEDAPRPGVDINDQVSELRGR